MNALDQDSIAMLGKAIEIVGAKAATNMKALVVYNEGSNFSAGANIGIGLYMANVAAWPLVEAMIANGQDAYKALKYANFPTVGAPANLALGGGCEILLHCAAVQAHAETYTGLVETGVGIVPGWGGCKEVLTRHMLNDKRPRGPMPAIGQAFEQIALAKVSKSAAEAFDLFYLRPGDGVTMNRDRLLADAKAKALSLAKDYHPPQPVRLNLPGPTARVGLGLVVHDLQRQGKATPYDGIVTDRLAEVLSGGDTDMLDEIGEDEILALERKAVVDLFHDPRTLARMEQMLETGKPLRN
jgi:3-hydroxyacyl-CoA dehydrogenase